MLPETGDFFSVMYHYVRPNEDSNLNYLEVQDFQTQLDYFEEKFGIISHSEWENFRKTGKKPKGALLTFDDGLKDHYTEVLPILHKRGIFAIFYVCTNPLQNLALPVHLTHYLLAKNDVKIIWNRLEIKGLPKEFNRIFDHKTRHAYLEQSSSQLEKKLKRLINWATEDIGQKDLIEEIFFEMTNLSQPQFLKSWNLNEFEIRDIYNKGFEIGSHSCSHRLMSNLNGAEVETELFISKKILSDVCNTDIKSFCYPYGGTYSYSHLVLTKLNQLKYSEAFSVNPQSIKNNFLKKNSKFELPRYDCNLF